MESGYPGAPPGWYPDPAGGPGQRWWDGYTWTEATVLPQHPPPPPWVTAGPPLGPATEVAPWAVAAGRLSAHSTRGAVERELRMTGAARIAVAVPAACSIASFIVYRFHADAYLALGHQLRVDWHDAQIDKTAPAYHGPSVSTTANLVINLAFVVAAVVALMWQHRAASAGRALGIPSRRSPAWGVGSWFVPVVWWWIPYTAVRDCLPPNDTHRARVLHWWLAWLFAQVAGFAVGVCALFSSGTALVLAVPVLFANVAIVFWAPGIVSAIASSHREAADRLIESEGALQG